MAIDTGIHNMVNCNTLFSQAARINPIFMAENYVIDVVDYRGIRTVFTEKRWKTKSVFHPELLSQTFLKNVERTIKDPEEVWEDYADSEHRCCYYRKYSVRTYVKVVIWMDGDCQVITAFETDFIKESKYPTKQLK